MFKSKKGQFIAILSPEKKKQCIFYTTAKLFHFNVVTAILFVQNIVDRI